MSRPTPPPPMKEKKGFMSLRNNVFAAKLLLWKELPPLEHFLVDIIIEKTIGWRTKEAMITIEEFIERTEKKSTHIYAALRRLRERKLLICTKLKHGTIYGLNEDYFGGLLIKSHEEAYLARRNKIKVVVDNSKNTNENSSVGVTKIRQCDRRKLVTPSDAYVHKKSSSQLESLGNLLPKDILKDTIKDILKDSNPQTGENGESFTRFGNKSGKPKRTPQEHEKIIREQLEAMRSELKEAVK